MQAALLDVLRSFPGPDDRAYVSASAARCVERRALKRRRRIARKEASVSPLPATDPYDHAATGCGAELADEKAIDPVTSCLDREEQRALRGLLLELPADERAVVTLRGAGAGTPEICQSLA